jgi:uncharacterized repeat protein (TIGR03803 family)
MQEFLTPVFAPSIENINQQRRLNSAVRRSHRAAILLLTSLLALALFIVPAQAQTYTVLHSFKGFPHDGRTPLGGVVLDPAGNLYGTTEFGGHFGDGTVFRLAANGTETILFNFYKSQTLDAGVFPQGGLVRDAAGNLYGTTERGGVESDCPFHPYGTGCGTVFKVSATGHLTVLHRFHFNDGALAISAPALTLDGAGNLYGTTLGGGFPFDIGNGVVFKLAPSGKLSVLFKFGTNGTDTGFGPYGGVVRDANGNLYGTTVNGGAAAGVVYKLDTSNKETVLHVFNGPGDGENPMSGVIIDSAGNLYGTAQGGGSFFNCAGFAGCGFVFKLDASGTETILYDFTGGTDGGNPFGGLIRDSAGNLFGTTTFGGDLTCNAPQGCGVVYKLDTAGTQTVLHAFSGGTDGAYPDDSLVLDSGGNLYGTASAGGDRTGCSANGCGVVFKIAH